jgi:hypothetical protein
MTGSQTGFATADMRTARAPLDSLPQRLLAGDGHALVRFVRKLAQSGTVSDENFAAIKAAGYSDAQLVEIGLAFATIVFINVFNRINDTEIDFPAVARSVSALSNRKYESITTMTTQMSRRLEERATTCRLLRTQRRRTLIGTRLSARTCKAELVRLIEADFDNLVARIPAIM